MTSCNHVIWLFSRDLIIFHLGIEHFELWDLIWIEVVKEECKRTPHETGLVLNNSFIYT